MSYLLLIVLICIVAVAVLWIFQKGYLRDKSSNQILLLGIELTVFGGILIIGGNNVIYGIADIGLIFAIIGLITSVFGFFKK
jgi:hypothetical protein